MLEKTRTDPIQELRKLEAAEKEALERLKVYATTGNGADEEARRLGKEWRKASAARLSAVFAALPALLDVVEAAEEVTDHVDFGKPPPGWYELRAAVSRLKVH